MAYSVHFAEDVDVPADSRTKALEILLAISETLESIPSSSAFWSAANNGLAELNLGGWKFEYRILHRDRRICPNPLTSINKWGCTAPGEPDIVDPGGNPCQSY